MSSNISLVEDAVVLAAGMGSRLPGYEVPKPLVEVAGKPLLKRTFEGLASAGVKRIYLVLGFKAEVIARSVRSWGRDLKVDINLVLNCHWERPNGLSLAVCANPLAGRSFVLTMADHLFDPGIVKDLVKVGPPSRGVCLAVDTQPERVFDIDDATKVVFDDQDRRITDIGKTLASYNAVDTGLFVCTTAIFDALANAFTKGSYSLSDGMRELAAQGRFLGMPVEGRYWQDVDTPQMLAQAEKDLGQGALADSAGRR